MIDGSTFASPAVVFYRTRVGDLIVQSAPHRFEDLAFWAGTLNALERHTSGLCCHSSCGSSLNDDGCGLRRFICLCGRFTAAEAPCRLLSSQDVFIRIVTNNGDRELTFTSSPAARMILRMKPSSKPRSLAVARSVSTSAMNCPDSISSPSLPTSLPSSSPQGEAASIKKNSPCGCPCHQRYREICCSRNFRVYSSMYLAILTEVNDLKCIQPLLCCWHYSLLEHSSVGLWDISIVTLSTGAESWLKQAAEHVRRFGTHPANK